MSLTDPISTFEQRLLAQRRRRAILQRYVLRPDLFIQECFIWPPGQSPAEYQLECARALIQHKRVAIRAPHSSGKTALSAALVLWYAETREFLSAQTKEDWKVVTTASVWRQLEEYLWPEIHKWVRRLNWAHLGRLPYREHVELHAFSLALDYGTAFAAASDKASALEGAHAKHLLYVLDEAKRLAVDTPIPTPTGWTSMGQLQVGDRVLDESGQPCQVTSASLVLSDRPCYRVVFHDGSEIVADEGHLWATLPHVRRRTWRAIHRNDPRYKKVYPQVRDWRDWWDRAEVVTTAQLIPLPDGSAIPTCRPLVLPDVMLPIDPYVLGAWLGDGSSWSGGISSMDLEIVDRIREAGYVVHQWSHHGRAAETYGVLGLKTQLRRLGLVRNKHIPAIYLRASYRQRLELLKGLMDTDGTVTLNGKDSRITFTSVKYALVHNVAELIRTFGWAVRVWEGEATFQGKKYGPVYVLRWSADVCCFHLTRKAVRWLPRGAQASASTIRTIRSVERVKSVPTRCIAVDSPRRLYLAGTGFIPTHNSIPDNTFDAAEGAFMAGEHGEIFVLTVSTPGDPQGRFYDIHRRKPGLEDWHPRHITLAEAVAAGRIDQKIADQRRLQWGEESQVFQNRVLGNFAAIGEKSVIPLAWVEAANDRWRAWRAALDPEDPQKVTRLGLDVGHSGPDPTVLAIEIEGDVISELLRWSRQSTMETTGQLVAAAGPDPERAPIMVVDPIGVGAGVLDRTRELGYRVRGFNAAKAAKLIDPATQRTVEIRDRSGAFGFVNLRSAAWWGLRESLDPVYFPTLALPPDDGLIGELTTPRYEVTSQGRIKIESKDDIFERLSRSTDAADAVVMLRASYLLDPESEPMVVL